MQVKKCHRVTSKRLQSMAAGLPETLENCCGQDSCVLRGRHWTMADRSGFMAWGMDGKLA